VVGITNRDICDQQAKGKTGRKRMKEALSFPVEAVREGKEKAASD
jgi:hypothetical protein